MDKDGTGENHAGLPLLGTLLPQWLAVNRRSQKSLVLEMLWVINDVQHESAQDNLSRVDFEYEPNQLT